MDGRAPERSRPAIHDRRRLSGRVSGRAAAQPPWLCAVRALGGLTVASLLFCAVCGGLLRLGVLVPGTAGAFWLGPATLDHAALMIEGFLATVIGIERAVAVKHPAAFAGALASAAGGLALLVGAHGMAAGLFVASSLVLAIVQGVLVWRQRAAHTTFLLIGALASLCGNLLFAAGAGRAAALPWWFSFLVATIAAERLELSRLLRLSLRVSQALWGALGLMLVGAAVFVRAAAVGGFVFGAALLLIAVWLATFDVARRTVRIRGLSRYVAVALLCGYAWLAVAGLAWCAMAFGWPLRDVALHALALGFVFSMVMGHAPVIVPAVARVKLRFRTIFYLPLAALHVSLLVRLGPGLFDPAWREAGAVINALSIAAFLVVMAGSAWAAHGGRTVALAAPPLGE